MIGYDAWKTHNPYDNELRSIQDDEPIEEEDDVDEDAFAKAIENMENCKNEMLALEDRLDNVSEDLTMIIVKLRTAITEAEAHLNQEIPYRDAKFNESTNRYGKGWTT